MHALLGAAATTMVLLPFVQRNSARPPVPGAGAAAVPAGVAPAAASAAPVSVQQLPVQAADWDLLALGNASRRWDFVPPGASICPPAVPSARAPVLIEEVAFGILTSERYLATRLQALQRTWLRHVRDVVFYSESVVASLPTVRLQPPAGENLIGGGAWKNFPALLDLHARFPTHKWIYFCDDDTFVYVGNMLRTLGQMDHTAPVYLGLYWTPRVDMEWREVKLAYASGGAGYALSRGMMDKLAPLLPDCHAKYLRWAGDLRVGKCVLDAGVRITPGVGFHHEAHDKYTWDRLGGGFPYGRLAPRASAAVSSPVSFHHLTPDHSAQYYRMQFADERGPHGEVWRRDFGPFMLKEYIAYSAPLRHTFRVLFGVSVEVSSGDFAAREAQAAIEAEQSGANPNEGKKPEANWRRDFSDPLWWRAAALPGSGERVYEMAVGKVPEIFNGDGCAAQVDDAWRQPLRKVALVTVLCRPCVPLGAAADARPEYDQLCNVTRENGCTLRLMLALRCPPRELLVPQQLDVGTAPGAADVVRAGVPVAGCAAAAAAAAPLTLDAAAPALHLSLTHGALELGAPRLAVRPAHCAATAVAAVGVLRAAAPPHALPIACTCAAPTAVANVTVTLVVVDAVTSPTFSVLVPCAKA